MSGQIIIGRSGSLYLAKGHGRRGRSGTADGVTLFLLLEVIRSIGVAVMRAIVVIITVLVDAVEGDDRLGHCGGGVGRGRGVGGGRAKSGETKGLILKAAKGHAGPEALRQVIRVGNDATTKKVGVGLGGLESLGAMWAGMGVK